MKLPWWPSTVERMQRPDVVMVVHDLATNQLLLSKINPGGTGLHGHRGLAGLASVGGSSCKTEHDSRTAVSTQGSRAGKKGSIDSTPSFRGWRHCGRGACSLTRPSPNELFVASYAVGRNSFCRVVPWITETTYSSSGKPYPSGVETYQTRLLPLQLARASRSHQTHCSI